MPFLNVKVCVNVQQFPGDDIPIIRGSALMALKGERPELGSSKILELMEVKTTPLPP